MRHLSASIASVALVAAGLFAPTAAAAPPPGNGPKVYTEAHRITWKSGFTNYIHRVDAKIAWTARPKKGVYLQYVRLSSPKCSDFEKAAFQDVWIMANSRGTQYVNASCPKLYPIAPGHRVYTTNRVHIFISLKAGVSHDFDKQLRYKFDICRKGGC